MTSNIRLSPIPDGYVIVAGPDNLEYVLPDFLVPALHQMFDGYRKKLDLDAFRQAGSVSGLTSNGIYFGKTYEYIFFRYTNQIARLLQSSKRVK
jgi:hypothetical protein